MYVGRQGMSVCWESRTELSVCWESVGECILSVWVENQGAYVRYLNLGASVCFQLGGWLRRGPRVRRRYTCLEKHYVKCTSQLNECKTTFVVGCNYCADTRK